MSTKITFAILFISLISYGQQIRSDCKETLRQTPYFSRHRVTSPSDSLQMDLDILKHCGNLDSIDSKLLTGPILASIMIRLTTNDKEISYEAILNSISEFKKTEDYAKFRKAMMSTNMQGNVFPGYAVPETNKALPQKIEFIKLTDLESAIKSGKEQGKRVLIYFSCYACVNSRKVEDRILTDHAVQALLADKFSRFVAYADDNTEDKVSGSTIGKKIIKLQHDYFKTDYQPYFYIIDNEGKVLSEIGYTNKTEEFVEFLNKGLN